MQVLSGGVWSVPANCRAGELQSVLRRRDGDHELIEPKAASVWRALKPTRAALMPEISHASLCISTSQIL